MVFGLLGCLEFSQFVRKVTEQQAASNAVTTYME